MSIDASPTVVSQTSISTPARFTVSQFDRMIKAGVLSDVSQKLQLFRGEILYMTPPNPPHDDVIRVLSAWAYSRLVESGTGSQVEVCVQLSMDLPDQDSVVSPDLMFVTSQSYSSRRPNAKDTRLLIEVSDSSLAHDTNEKRDLYAEAEVQEYWVIDIPHRSLIVHREPADGRYRSVQTYNETQPTEPLALPGLSLTIATLFR